MPTGMSIHIGLNKVDPDAYESWDGKLVACEADAKDMAKLASSKGFKSKKLLTAAATSSAILEALSDAASAMSADDILLLTYSGHGGQVPDSNSDEEDRVDETWCAYDREIVDDELYSAWAVFPAGARILVLSDSCHSGTAVRAVLEAVRPDALSETVDSGDVEPGNLMKGMPEDIAQRTYAKHKSLYDGIQKKVPAFDKAPLEVSVLLISGCQDNQTSADGKRNGLFTQTLLKVWDQGQFRGSYRKFAKEIVKNMPPWQVPNFFTAGEPSRKFERQQPFTISSGA
jgi:metacaspase-1